MGYTVRVQHVLSMRHNAIQERLRLLSKRVRDMPYKQMQMEPREMGKNVPGRSPARSQRAFTSGSSCAEAPMMMNMSSSSCINITVSLRVAI